MPPSRDAEPSGILFDDAENAPLVSSLNLPYRSGAPVSDVLHGLVGPSGLPDAPGVHPAVADLRDRIPLIIITCALHYAWRSPEVNSQGDGLTSIGDCTPLRDNKDLRSSGLPREARRRHVARSSGWIRAALVHRDRPVDAEAAGRPRAPGRNHFGVVARVLGDRDDLPGRRSRVDGLGVGILLRLREQ